MLKMPDLSELDLADAMEPKLSNSGRSAAFLTVDWLRVRTEVLKQTLVLKVPELSALRLSEQIGPCSSSAGHSLQHFATCSPPLSTVVCPLVLFFLLFPSLPHALAVRQ